MALHQLDLTFAALADPTRRAILERLAQGEANVTELMKPFDISQPAISKHLKVLENAGLISRGRDANFRPCRLEPEPLQIASKWIGGYRKFWEDSFDNLEKYVKQLQQTEQRAQAEKEREKRNAIAGKTRRNRKHRDNR